MRFLKVTAYVWLGLVGAGLALAIFGLQKQPILLGEVTGAAIGGFLGRKEIDVSPVYTNLAGICAGTIAIIIVVCVLRMYT